MLTDKQLKELDSRSFREKTGVTKTDYRFLRNLILAGANFKELSIWVPGESDDKELTLHEFCRKLRRIDVIYITRIQKERQV